MWSSSDQDDPLPFMLSTFGRDHRDRYDDQNSHGSNGSNNDPIIGNPHNRDNDRNDVLNSSSLFGSLVGNEMDLGTIESPAISAPIPYTNDVPGALRNSNHDMGDSDDSKTLQGSQNYGSLARDLFSVASKGLLRASAGLNIDISVDSSSVNMNLPASQAGGRATTYPTVTTSNVVSLTNNNYAGGRIGGEDSVTGSNSTSISNFRADTGREEVNVDELTDKMSKIWFDPGKSRIYDYKHDEDGKLIVQYEKRRQVSHDVFEMVVSGALNKVQARELFEMNPHEREAINNEIHGVESRCIEETPSVVFSAMHLMRNKIHGFTDRELEGDGKSPALFSTNAYKRGLELQSEYIQSNDFQIRFLRAQLFDITKAAVQYFRYLDLLHSFFGDEALMRPLYLTDLTKREIRYLKKGQQQLLPSRDRSGRRIYAYLGCNNTEFTLREKYRTQTYLFDVVAQDVTTQKMGLVFIGMIQRSGKVDIGSEQNGPEYLRRSTQACPVRWSAVHLCFPDTFVHNFVKAIFFLYFDKQRRSLLRLYSGSQIESNYHLCGFGIPSGDIPMTCSGKVKTKTVAKFIHARTSIESFQKEVIERRWKQLEEKQKTDPSRRSKIMTTNVIPSCPGIECPDLNSVVFGDKSMYEHSANAKFRCFLRDLEQQRMDRIANYDETLTSVSGFVDCIIRKALSAEHSFRFYSYEKKYSLYQEISEPDELHKRVHQVLRDVRKRSRVNEKELLRPTPAVPEVAPELGQKGRTVVSPTELEGSSVMGLAPNKRTKTTGLCSC